MDNPILEPIREALIKGRAPDVTALVQQALQEGVAASEILDNALCQGMGVIGERFKRNEVFVPQVLLAARAMKQATDILRPHLVAAGVKPFATAVIGTIKGDLHDIGKNLVRMMMEGAGYKVIDLGVDVAPEKFVAAVQENPGCIVGLSALLTTTMINMETITKAVKEVAPATVVAVGGAPLTQEFCDKIGADAYSADPQGLIEWLSSRN